MSAARGAGGAWGRLLSCVSAVRPASTLIRVIPTVRETTLDPLLISLNSDSHPGILVCGEDAARDLKSMSSRRAPAVSVRHVSADPQYVAAHPDCHALEVLTDKSRESVIVLPGDHSEAVLSRIGACCDPGMDITIIDQQARGPVAVSLAKSGTHLLARTLRKLGYEVAGPGGDFRYSGIRQAAAALRMAERLGQNMPRFAGTDSLYYAHALSSASLICRMLLPGPLRSALKLDELPFESDLRRLPRNLAIMLHDLPLNKVDRSFFDAWCKRREPTVVFNYRDPRAMLCSYVRYLTRDRGNIGRFPDQLAHAEILQAKRSHSERLMHAITDSTFPFRDALAASTWLLHHPRTLKLRYEDMVGEQGGGTLEHQHRALFALMLRLRCAGDIAQVARTLYDTESHTFDQGRVDGWRAEFGPEHHEAFAERFSDLLRTYGYSQD